MTCIYCYIHKRKVMTFKEMAAKCKLQMWSVNVMNADENVIRRCRRPWKIVTWRWREDQPERHSEISKALREFPRWSQYCKILIEYCKILQNIAKYCKILQNIAKYCKLETQWKMFEENCQDLLSICVVFLGRLGECTWGHCILIVTNCTASMFTSCHWLSA